MFETGKSIDEVKTYANRVDAQVNAIHDDVFRQAKLKWGPDGFAATVTSKQIGNFTRDKSSWEDWKRWRDLWKAKKADVDDSWFGSDDRYTEIEKFDVEAKAWRKKWDDLGYYLGAPTTAEVQKTKDGGEKVVHPDVEPPGPKGLSMGNILLIMGGAVVLGGGVGYYMKKQRKTSSMPSASFSEGARYVLPSRAMVYDRR